MTREEEILERGSKLSEGLKRAFNDLLTFYVEHEYEHDDMIDRLEKFLNSVERRNNEKAV